MCILLIPACHFSCVPLRQAVFVAVLRLRHVQAAWLCHLCALRTSYAMPCHGACLKSGCLGSGSRWSIITGSNVKITLHHECQHSLFALHLFTERVLIDMAQLYGPSLEACISAFERRCERLMWGTPLLCVASVDPKARFCTQARSSVI